MTDISPATLAKIARRIGIVAEPVDGGVFMREPTAMYGHTMTVDGLADYLLTGDRPLRVIGSWDAAGYDWQVGGRTKAGKVNARVMMLDGDNLWRVLADVWEDTPALAIVRCAEALEEGNE